MIRFDTSSGRLASQAADCLAIGLFDEERLEGAARELDAASKGQLRRLRADGDISTKPGEAQMLLQLPGVRARRVLVVGLGRRADFNRRAWRKAVGIALTTCLKGRSAHLAIAIERPDAKVLNDYYLGRAIADLSNEAVYRVNDFKSGRRPRPPALKRVTLAGIAASARAAAGKGLAHGGDIAEGQSLLRDLGNLPGNVCTPRYLADQARAIARSHRTVRVRVFDEAAIRRLKMGCLLAVARGSAEPPRFIVLEYRGGRRGAAPVVLVGKGVTFDTGGISLKDPAAMDEMKYDMCGAGSVLATLRVAAAMKLPINVVGLIPAVENMPDGRATKPGDIATSAAGKTVEILNTDAEGRLILCDALHYARRFEPAAVVDIATLTGACVIALGHVATGMFSNKDELARELMEAGTVAWDRTWPMPLWDDYQEQIKSPFADMANIGGRPAGSVTAACFLSRFARKYPWVHLDIAGTAWKSGRDKGSTGRPVPLLTTFLMRRAG